MCQAGLDGEQNKHSAHPHDRYSVGRGLKDNCTVTNWDKYHEDKNGGKDFERKVP